MNEKDIKDINKINNSIHAVVQKIKINPLRLYVLNAANVIISPVLLKLKLLII